MGLKSDTQNLADIRTRTFAFIIDVAVIGLSRMAIEALNIPDLSISETGSLLVDGILSIMLIFIYLCILPLYFEGSTLGKLAMGIRIVPTDGHPLTIWRLFLRNWIGYMMSGIPAGVGFFWAVHNENRQTWHDIVNNTVVVKRE